MPKKTFNNVSMTIARFAKNKDINGRMFDTDELIQLITEIPFDKVNIPLHTYNCLVYDNDDRAGNTVCGYIEGYDAEADAFNVVIHEKHADLVLGYSSPVIYPRLMLDADNNIIKIKGFDVCPKLYYSFIR